MPHAILGSRPLRCAVSLQRQGKSSSILQRMSSGRSVVVKKIRLPAANEI